MKKKTKAISVMLIIIAMLFVAIPKIVNAVTINSTPKDYIYIKENKKTFLPKDKIYLDINYDGQLPENASCIIAHQYYGTTETANAVSDFNSGIDYYGNLIEGRN